MPRGSEIPLKGTSRRSGLGVLRTGGFISPIGLYGCGLWLIGKVSSSRDATFNLYQSARSLLIKVKRLLLKFSENLYCKVVAQRRDEPK